MRRRGTPRDRPRQRDLPTTRPGGSEPVLRPCRRADFATVRGLLEDAGLCADGLEDQFGDAYVVADSAGEAAGCAGLEIHGPFGLLRSVVVATRNRRQGLGEALVESRVERAKSQGLRAVYLLTTTAAAYFERFGFAPVDRRDVPFEIRRTVEYSEACPQNATVMELKIRVERGSKEESRMDIKKKVRERYAEAARRVPEVSRRGETDKNRGCCGGEEVIAQSTITSNLYDAGELGNVPLDAALASAGCGNPTAVAELKPGEVVLDLGSGGGIDVLLSAKRVGPTGKVYGLDMTDEMLELARENQRKASIDNVEFLKGDIESVPLPDDSVDVVISNCVINLSPDKRRVLREAYRVLKPGGRLAVADIVSRGPIPDDIRGDAELWTGCIAGALEDEQYRKYLEEAGFEQIDIEATRVFRVERTGCCGGGGVRVGIDASEDPGEGNFMSALVRAVKPHPSG